MRKPGIFATWSRPAADPGWLPLRSSRMGLRRLLASLFLAAAVGTGLRVVAPAAPAQLTVVTAQRSIAAGSVLTAGDLRLRTVPKSAITDAAIVQLSQATGQRVSAGLQRGELLTTSRLLGSESLRARPGYVLAGVRLADPGLAQLIQPGQQVDVLVSPAEAKQARVVARAATVIAGPAGSEPPGSGWAPLGTGGGVDALGGGALIVLSVLPNIAAEVTQAAAMGPLSVTLR